MTTTNLGPLRVSETPDALTFEIDWRAQRSAQDEKFDVFITGVLMIGGVLMFVWLEWLTVGTVVGLLGVISAYATAARIFNKTRIHITKEQLHVRTLPLSFLTGSANHTQPTEHIRQILVQSIESDHDTAYVVNVRNHDDTEHHLFTLRDTPEIAVQVEQRIEAFLGIEDDPHLQSIYADDQPLS